MELTWDFENPPHVTPTRPYFQILPSILATGTTYVKGEFPFKLPHLQILNFYPFRDVVPQNNLENLEKLESQWAKIAPLCLRPR